MLISNIQPGTGCCGNASLKRAEQPAAQPRSRNAGPDTASFSAEALRLAGYGGSSEARTCEQAIEKATNNQPESYRKVSLSGNKTDFLSMLLESLFLAEREESTSAMERGGSAPPEQAAEAGPRRLLQDRPRAAELKKTL